MQVRSMLRRAQAPVPVLTEERPSPMMTDLAYIDEATNNAVAKEVVAPTIDAKARADIKAKSHKSIAGFRIQDEEAEKKMLDNMIAERRQRLEQFIKDRDTVKDALGKLGVTPLAVLPTMAWNAICVSTKLYRLNPDRENQIQPDKNSLSKAFPGYADFLAAEIRECITKTPLKFLELAFPNYHESHSSGATLTLVLPPPPADVAQILLKAQSRTLKVAAVGEAIRFAETPEQIGHMLAYSKQDRWAQEQGYADYADWVKRDPIIYTEEGTATAIIAQFGDFPIEKQVVDFVVQSDKLIPDKVDSVNPLACRILPVVGTWCTTPASPDGLVSSLRFGQ